MEADGNNPDENGGTLVRIFPTDSDSDDETNGSNNSSGDERNIQHNFDTALPVRHSYLGNNLEELRGRTVLEDGSIQTLPILRQSGLILVPGQTLPLTVSNPTTVSMFRNIIQADRTFGVVGMLQLHTSVPEMCNVGTTAEIYEFQDEEYEGIRIKAKGRQRFTIVETQRSSNGSLIAKVKILPEVILPDPLSDINITSLNRYRQYGKCLSCNSRDAIMTRWPTWVYSQYQFHYLIPRIMNHLTHLFGGANSISIPSDPVELSFWVAQNMSFTDEHKLILLGVNSAVQRLRIELRILDSCKILYCNGCHSKVARSEDVFSMSVEGPQGTYVNPTGYVHETITVYKAQSLRVLDDDPATEYSWFPGYAWVIAECNHCQRHMGWKFTAVKSGLKPKKFWGLCRQSLLMPKIDVNKSILVM